MEYGRNDLPRKAVWSIYNAAVKVNFEPLGITQMTTAYSRTNDIKDVVTKANKLHQAPCNEASKYSLGEQSVIW